MVALARRHAMPCHAEKSTDRWETGQCLPRGTCGLATSASVTTSPCRCRPGSGSTLSETPRRRTASTSQRSRQASVLVWFSFISVGVFTVLFWFQIKHLKTTTSRPSKASDGCCGSFVVSAVSSGGARTIDAVGVCFLAVGGLASTTVQ